MQDFLDFNFSEFSFGIAKEISKEAALIKGQDIDYDLSIKKHIDNNLYYIKECCDCEIEKR